MSYHIAVDIGASSGRVILANKDSDKFMEEVHRFDNKIIEQDDHIFWDIDYLIKEIIVGLEKIKQRGILSATLGVDTWAVDYVLVDSQGNKVSNPICYRDSRTKGKIEEFTNQISKEEIYQRTGIQFLEFNTIYQLYAEDKDILDKSSHILFIPDYINYVLTGKTIAEMTNISTSQYLNIHHRDYDRKILEYLEIDDNKFPDLVKPGTFIGQISKDISNNHDIPQIDVYAVASHDTASAVVGVPASEDDFIYISSGTWSLIGTENKEPLVSDESFKHNYTNEWGAYDSFRFLKNISGMWAIQEISRNLDGEYSYQELRDLSTEVEPFRQLIDLNDPRFTKPENMIEEIKNYCIESKQIVPETIGELVQAVYSNLALLYANEFETIREVTRKNVDKLYIVGGGSQVAELNQLTSNLLNVEVTAGPKEATALGNLMVQMISTDEFSDLREARIWVRESEKLETFYPDGKNYEEILVGFKNHIKERRK